MMQDLLEKFEFFPIKCRIQRAMEMLRISQEQAVAKGGRAGPPSKIKARSTVLETETAGQLLT
jgi:hypothetical protein